MQNKIKKNYSNIISKLINLSMVSMFSSVPVEKRNVVACIFLEDRHELDFCDGNISPNGLRSLIIEQTRRCNQSLACFDPSSTYTQPPCLNLHALLIICQDFVVFFFPNQAVEICF